jgi:hypothetical protein
MIRRRTNTGTRLSSGMSVRPDGCSPGIRGRHSGGRGVWRLLAGALTIGVLLSPGAGGACAGCGDDAAPGVVVPQAAGIAPVHAAAAAARLHHRCCMVGAASVNQPTSAAACCCHPVCDPQAAADGGALPGAADPCGCLLAPSGDSPALPVRPRADDPRETPVGFAQVSLLPAEDVGPIGVGGAAVVLPAHARPLRVLYGVWRN